VNGITTATQTIAVTTSNTANHAPVIDESTIADGLVSELAGTFQSSTLDSASGTLRFSDADVSDTHKVSVSSVSATGVTWALPSNATLLKYLTQGPVTEPTLNDTEANGTARLAFILVSALAPLVDSLRFHQEGDAERAASFARLGRAEVERAMKLITAEAECCAPTPHALAARVCRQCEPETATGTATSAAAGDAR